MCLTGTGAKKGGFGTPWGSEGPYLPAKEKVFAHICAMMWGWPIADW